MKSFKLSLALLVVFASGSSSLQAMDTPGSGSKSKIRKSPQRKQATPVKNTLEQSAANSLAAFQPELDKINTELAAKQAELKTVQDDTKMGVVKRQAAVVELEKQVKAIEVRKVNAERLVELAAAQAQNAQQATPSKDTQTERKTTAAIEEESAEAADDGEQAVDFHTTPVKPKVDVSATETPAPTPVKEATPKAEKEGEKSPEDSGVPADLQERLTEAKRQEAAKFAADAAEKARKDAKAEADRLAVEQAAENKRQADALEAQRAQEQRREQERLDAEQKAKADQDAKDAAAQAQRLAEEKAAQDAKAKAEADAAKVKAYTPAKTRFILDLKKWTKAHMLKARLAAYRDAKKDKKAQLSSEAIADTVEQMEKIDFAAMYDALNNRENYNKHAGKGFIYSIRNRTEINNAIKADKKAFYAFVGEQIEKMESFHRPYLEAHVLEGYAIHANKGWFARRASNVFSRPVLTTVSVAAVFVAAYLYINRR